MNADARSTIRDLARKAKVSVATVSRVLNSPSQVRVNTREKVLKAMEQCHYVYNALAGSLSARKTTMLGVIIPTITNPIFATVTKGIQDYAAQSGYSILLGNTDYNVENERQLINLFQGLGVSRSRMPGAKSIRKPATHESISRARQGRNSVSQRNTNIKGNLSP